MYKTAVYCIVIMSVLSFGLGNAIECYECVGQRTIRPDRCYRGETSLMNKTTCDGHCVTYQFLATKCENYGVVKRACVPRSATCDDIVKTVIDRIDNLNVPYGSKLDITSNCVFCSDTLCNEAETISPLFCIPLILSLITKIV